MTRMTTLIGFTFTLMLCGCSAEKPRDLAAGFRDPPASAKPHTWWHWMNGNITREGITADLEAMQQIGLGGAQIFNVSEAIPDGPVLFMSPTWREMVQHAVKEAERLHLELCIHNCAGWSSSGGPWIKPEQAMQIVVTSEKQARGPSRFAELLAQPETRRDCYRDIAVLAFPTPADDRQRIKNYEIKAGYEDKYGQQPQLVQFPPGSIVRRDTIVDLTSSMRPDGKLEWDVPAGDWTILRFGYTPTGKENHPSPVSGRGLECDKLSREALDAHWAGMMGPVIQDVGPLAGQVLNNALIDSYEVGPQNWTPRFREEFWQRRGYDPLLMLPALTGRVVDSGEISERFLWDFRRTIADLFADNYFGYFSELCRRHGMLTSIEPYDGPFECLLAGRPADIPMGEFWVGGGESSSCKLAASVAHTYGRRIVGAESFTADPSTGRWQSHPYSLKAIGDLMYCTGINRFIVHRYAHQPWLDKLPGMTMGQWGTHFERTVTWWPQGADWIRYLTRCQYLLQQGTFAADVCYFAGEAAPNTAPHVPALKAAGYDYDACNADVLLNRLFVRDGLLVLPDGPSYRLLVLPPDTPFMTPRLLAKVRDLVAQGATVVGPRPAKSPSLSDYPQCDATVDQLASEVWGDCDGQRIPQHVLGRGRVVWGQTPEEILAASQVPPDCSFRTPTGKPRMAWIHRVIDGADLYFVSNQKPFAQDVECTFRVAGKVPELWHPDTGATEVAPVWSEQDGRTTLPLRFDPAGSVFVVFRRPSPGVEHVVAVKPPQPGSAQPSEPAIKIIKAVFEADDGAGGADVTARVVELVEAGELSIPANNATFGDPSYMHVKHLRIEYTYDGKAMSKTVRENEELHLAEKAGPPAPPAFVLTRASNGQLELRAFEPGSYEFQWASGRTTKAAAKANPAPLEITGPWTLRFQANRGAPARVTLDKLISWTEHGDAGVRYFSGTAEYEKEFEIPSSLLTPDGVLYLDLGDVQCIAEVELNGKSLGTWWKPPFAAEVAGIAHSGRNLLKVRVTNLWINRLIGDEQYPPDCEWNGPALKGWPAWLVEGQPRPVAERLTFTTWKHYARDSALVDSGLLGPVQLRAAERITVE